MEKFIVILKGGQVMSFTDYEEAFHASEQYTKMTGNVCCVERVTVHPAKSA